MLPGALVALALALLPASAVAQGESLERLFLAELKGKLRGDEYFKELRIEVADDEPPLALLTQNPPSQKNRTFYLPWMHKLQGNVHATYLRPLGLTRRSSHPVTPVIVLANDAALSDYWETRSGTKEVVASSTFDAALGSVVTSESGTAAWLRRQPVLRDMTLGMLVAHSARGAENDELWFRRGFAGYVSYHTGTRTSALDDHKPDRYAVRFLFDLLRQKERRKALWVSLEALMGQEDLAGLDPHARDEEPSARKVFDDTACIWMHFLHHGQDGQYRDGAADYLGRTLAGEGGKPAFEECFGTGDLEALESEFEAYIFDLFDRIFVEPSSTPDLAAAEAQEEPQEPIDLTSLIGRPTEVAEALGMALWSAQNGRIEPAIRTLAEFSPSLEGDDLARVDFELVRLRALRDARTAFFAAAVSEGSKVRLTWNDERVNDVPTALESGVLQFVKEESSFSIPLNELDSVSLALTLGAAMDDLGAGWLRAYAYALAEDPRWKRFLRDDGEQGTRLASDAEGPIRTWLTAGRTLGALSDLAQLGTPTTAEQARVALEQITALMELAAPGASESQRARIDGHRAVLGALAQRALRLRYLDDGVQEALNGEVEALADGQLRITYNFTEKAQFKDFEEVPEYLKWRLDQLRATPAKRDFKVEKKTLSGSGAHCFRHKLKFGAPMSVAYEFEFNKKTAKESDLAEVMVGICDDGAGSYLACYAQGELQIEQRRLKSFDMIGRDEEPSAYMIGHPHPMGIKHDGRLVSTWREGEKRQESPCLGLTSGYIFLWVALSGTLRFDNIVIEGVPDPVGLRELRDGWVAEQLKKLTLD
ncbi:MAG: hypothetical protein ACI8QZ_002064 [Chlamydiales bacterium]|jgi:hypothetical protein